MLKNFANAPLGDVMMLGEPQAIRNRTRINDMPKANRLCVNISVL
jgi:hypothetical protein